MATRPPAGGADEYHNPKLASVSLGSTRPPVVVSFTATRHLGGGLRATGRGSGYS